MMGKPSKVKTLDQRVLLMAAVGGVDGNLSVAINHLHLARQHIEFLLHLIERLPDDMPRIARPPKATKLKSRSDD